MIAQINGFEVNGATMSQQRNIQKTKLKKFSAINNSDNYGSKNEKRSKNNFLVSLGTLLFILGALTLSGLAKKA